MLRRNLLPITELLKHEDKRFLEQKEKSVDKKTIFELTMQPFAYRLTLNNREIESSREDPYAIQ